jgi:hypothetical protein
MYPSEFEEMGLIMHVALTAHHTPILMSRIRTSRISLGKTSNYCFEYLGDLSGTISNEVKQRIDFTTTMLRKKCYKTVLSQQRCSWKCSYIYFRIIQCFLWNNRLCSLCSSLTNSLLEICSPVPVLISRKREQKSDIQMCYGMFLEFFFLIQASTKSLPGYAVLHTR